MKKLPTDLQILNAIYERYYKTFALCADENKSRSTKNYVPIDIKVIGQDLKVDDEIIFGRLYYHLDKKHGYKQDDGSQVPFFGLRIGRDIHCVNFPLMASVLADLRLENRKFWTATAVAVFSLVVSIIAIVLSLNA